MDYLRLDRFQSHILGLCARRVMIRFHSHDPFDLQHFVQVNLFLFFFKKFPNNITGRFLAKCISRVIIRWEVFRYHLRHSLLIWMQSCFVEQSSEVNWYPIHLAVPMVLPFFSGSSFIALRIDASSSWFVSMTFPCFGCSSLTSDVYFLKIPASTRT